MENTFLSTLRKQFAYYKQLGDQTFPQVSDAGLHWRQDEASNSIAHIVQHLHGNMLSRWTDFLTTDGEKPWRDRETEFETQPLDRAALLQRWEAGWACLFQALDSLTADDLTRIIYIRNQGHTVQEALLRQLAHYPYHVGQIVQLGKMRAGVQWKSLSIPRGGSEAYNAEKFAQPQQIQHFTAEYLGGDARAALIRDLQEAHAAFWDSARAASESAWYTGRNGKWSVAQQVEHINLSIAPVARYLSSPREALEAKFGRLERGSMTREALRDKYEAHVRKGAVATPGYVPTAEIPVPADLLCAAGESHLQSLLRSLETWTDADLDSMLCPHPALGPLTVREMLYFTVIHCQHHHRAVMQIS